MKHYKLLIPDGTHQKGLYWIQRFGREWVYEKCGLFPSRDFEKHSRIKELDEDYFRNYQYIMEWWE